MHVHHREPITKDEKERRDDAAGFPDVSKLQTLCINCHAQHHGLTIRGIDPGELDEWRDFIGEIENASIP